jgi:hypothetical protein
VLERQRGVLAWPGFPSRLEEWLGAHHAIHVGTIGRRRLDSVLNRFDAGYLFELEIYEVDLVKLRAMPNPFEDPPPPAPEPQIERRG